MVPNTTYVPETAAPPSGPRRVVYVGWLSPDRGSAEMVELGRLLAPHGIAVELIGQADAAARAHIEAGGDAVHWHGFVPNAEALRLVEGALAGLSLLQDEANFRHSMPTKVAEYMARGVPVVTTPLPLAVDLVEAADGGFVVPFNDPRAAADAILKLDADPDLRVKMGLRAHEYALAQPGLAPARGRLRRPAGDLGQPGPRRQITARSACARSSVREAAPRGSFQNHAAVSRITA